jgi:hypothetical protein
MDFLVPGRFKICWTAQLLLAPKKKKKLCSMKLVSDIFGIFSYAKKTSIFVEWLWVAQINGHIRASTGMDCAAWSFGSVLLLDQIFSMILWVLTVTFLHRRKIYPIHASGVSLDEGSFEQDGTWQKVQWQILPMKNLMIVFEYISCALKLCQSSGVSPIISS